MSATPQDGEARERYLRLIGDLESEIADLDALLGGLLPRAWARDTQSKGWSIAHQVGHLALTERLMHSAITADPGFPELARTVKTKAVITDAELVDSRLGERQWANWKCTRDTLLADFRAAQPSERMRWVGPSMSMSTAVTSRIMEVWAHGEDIHAAVGARRPATDRLRHIAHLAVAARDFSFANRGLVPPTEPFRVEITGPSGQLWTWGPSEASQRVQGDAYDFALLATRRLHRSDAAVRAHGRDAVLWLRTIQAYAGPPGPRRRPEGANRRFTCLDRGAGLPTT